MAFHIENPSILSPIRLLGRQFMSLIAASTVALSHASVASAQASGEIHGGSGGRYFEYACGSGEVLVGLHGSAGVLIDSVQAVCARVDGPLRLASGSAKGPVFGGDRPFDRQADCPPQHAVTLAAVYENKTEPKVGAIALECTEITHREDGGSTEVELSGTGRLEGHSAPALGFGRGGIAVWELSSCPGQYAVGIRGRADRYLTAFGLICGPRPSGVATELPGPGVGRDSVSGAATQQSRRPNVTSPANSGTALGAATVSGRAAPQSNAVGPLRSAGGTVSTSVEGAPGAAATIPASPPSLGDAYAATLTIAESRCATDLKGTWQRNMRLGAGPPREIPLSSFSNLFGGSVVFDATDPTAVVQRGRILLNVGGVSVPARARFVGGFSPDASTFDVRFNASAPLCRVRGSVRGVRN